MSLIDNLIVFTALLAITGFILKWLVKYAEKHPKNKKTHSA